MQRLMYFARARYSLCNGDRRHSAPGWCFLLFWYILLNLKVNGGNVGSGRAQISINQRRVCMEGAARARLQCKRTRGAMQCGQMGAGHKHRCTGDGIGEGRDVI